jgi:hypothetical protein
MLVLSAGWSFHDSVAAPSERLLDAARAELFSVSPERTCGLCPSRCGYECHICEAVVRPNERVDYWQEKAET